MIVADKNRDARTVVVLAVLCAVLQLALAPNLALGNGRANFALIFSALIAMLMGGARGVIAGFVSGLFFDLSTTGPVGLMAFCLTVSSYVLGMEGRDRMAGDFGTSVLLFIAADLGVSLVYHLAMLLVGQASSIIDVLFLRTLPTALLTFIFFLPFAYYFARVRAAGLNLGGRGDRGSHLNMRGSRGPMDLSLIIICVCGVVAVALVIVFIIYGRSEANFTFDIGGASPRASGGSDASPEKTTSSRLVGLLVMVGAAFSALLARLWSMQLVSSEEYLEQAESNRTSTVYTQAPRGRILDRNGREIVGNRSSLTVVASSDLLDDEVEMHLLANLVGMPLQAVRRKIQDTTEGQQSLRTVSVDVSRRVVAFIGEHPEIFPGVDVQERTQRSYPHGSLAAHIVGYTGTVTAEQLEASKNAQEGDVVYRSGDIVGQTGIELEYESVLQGVRGEQTVFVDANGRVLDYSTNIGPQSGSDLVLTIDMDIQKAAEESLERVMSELRETGYSATGGCVVAVDCTNGEVIALASAPTFSPSVFTGGISTADWEALQDEGAHYPMMNRVIAGQYPSGSVIKPLTSFAALDYGIATPSSSWNCSGWWTWDGNPNSLPVMKCWWETGHGPMNLSDGITFSCDVVFYEIGKGFWNSDNPEGMQETFRRYGLGETTGIDLPGEAAGRIPDAEWKLNYFRELGYSEEDATWKGGDNANISIGQGDMLVTAIQMVCAYCSIANKGPVWRPHLMKGVRAKLGEGFVSEYRCETIRDVEEDETYRDVIATGMEGVIYREDPTQASHWTNLDISVRGKTGTAEQPGGDPIGWFIAYAPADNPKYVVGGNMDRVLQGASSAMYVVRDVFGAIYGQPDTSTETTSIAD